MPATANKVDDPCQECRGRHLKCTLLQYHNLLLESDVSHDNAFYRDGRKHFAVPMSAKVESKLIGYAGDDERPRCRNCQRLEKPCERTSGKRKFRFGSSAKYDQTFAKDQVWLGQTRSARLQFVDQGPELENYYCAEDSQQFTEEEVLRVQIQPEIITTSTSHGGSTDPFAPSDTTAVTTPKLSQIHSANTSALLSPASETSSSRRTEPSAKRRRADQSPSNALIRDIARSKSAETESNRFYSVNDVRKPAGVFGRHAIMSPEERQAELTKVYAEYERLEDDEAAWVPPDELLSPAVWQRYFFWPNEKTTMQCACLMRYYTDRLGPWLDIGDPSRHFTLVVPQRARRCPPLLNAIFTVAARHLTHLLQHRNSQGTVQYHGNVMPKLDKGFAIKYQNASIAYLRELCKHPEHVQDEDLLAATVILRYYDEFEASWDATEDETVFRSMQLFVAAQSDRSFLSQMSYGPIDFSVPGTFATVRDEIELYLKSYQHSSFRIALRQECTRAFMKQKSIGLDFGSWSILQGFDEADDFVWADRHLYHLACVLQFCFDEASQGQWSSVRWHELKRFEEQWEEHKPMSFAAIHYRSSNVAVGEPLPEIWYLADIHAAATQYFCLARILLTVYNPAVPRLGPGATSAAKRVSKEVRKLVLELCGIAKSMPGSEPALLQASMAIALCGEHISDPREQNALVNMLHTLERDHGFPTKTTVENLRQSWL